MDVMRGPPPAPGHNNVGAINSPPPTPPRPAIPPKPAKEKIISAGQRLSDATGAGFSRIHSTTESSCGTNANSDHDHHNIAHPHSARSPPSNGNLNSQSPCGILKSSSAVLSPPPTSGTNSNINHISPASGKPALPPKPVGAASLSSPPLTGRPPNKPSPLKFPPHTQPETVDNVRFANDNGPETTTPVLNGLTNGGIHSPPFLRAKPPPRKDPLLSPRGLPLSPNSRPTSSTSFNFSSPIQNLNSANFPSTSNGLNQSGAFVPTSPQRLAEIRVKSASLGRSPTFPFAPPPSESGGGIRGLISRKSATLSKFLPLDLHVGSSSRMFPPANNRQKPNSLNLNPFIIQQKQQQQAQMSQQQVQGHHPVINFGKSVVFSPESPLPPPPPPRLKKKLSPVNSVGSPTSPTSPTTPISALSSLAPTGPLPPPPPVSPNTLAMEPVAEMGEGGLAIYAEVNKQKKWEERKLKEEKTRRTSDPYSYPSTALNRPLQQSSAEAPPTSSHSPHNNSNSSQENSYAKIDESVSDLQSKERDIPNNQTLNHDENHSTNNNDASQPTKATVVDSWLGKYLNNNPITSNNTQSDPIRPTTPTYQSAKTGHIYEMIGEGAKNNDGVNNNNNNNGDNEPKKGDRESLGENQSFLFGHLVIGHMKPVAGVEDEGERKDDQAESEFKIEIIEKEKEPVGAHEKVDHTNAQPQEDILPEQQTQPEPEVIPPPPPPRLFQINGTPPPDNYLIPTVIQDVAVSTETSPAQVGEAGKTVGHNTGAGVGSTMELITPLRNSSILRRSSWNGDRIDSPTPSDSSSVTSSNSYLPYRHRIEKSYNSQDNSNRDSLQSRESWIDEGDLSNGALADAESSDVPPQSSIEDIVHMRGNVELCSTPSSASKSFNARRNRFVNSIFGSFGKGSSSSSGGSGGKRFSGLRNSGGAGGRRGKDKAQTQSLAMDSSPKLSHNPSNVSKWGRQISDSIISTTMISSPILPKSMSYGADMPTQKSQLVQFSPEVSQTRIIYGHDQDSSEDGSHENPTPLPGISEAVNPNVCIPPQVGGSHVPPLEDALKDDESVSSSESISACGSASGSISGFEDILTDLSPKEKKSFYVAREILTSERTFVDVLNLLTLEFPNAVIIANKFHGAPVISNEELNMILGGLPNLKRVNEDLLADLEERISKWKESPKIADILVKKGPFLKLYAMYIKDFHKYSANLDTFRQRYPLFGETIRDFESSERCQKLGLKHYMLKPVQRMPQYRLLLEDYLKSLEEESEDYEDTVKGIAIVKDVAEHANEAIRLQMNAEKLLDLQNRLPAGTIILKSDRQLIKDGELDKVCRKELQPRFFALMNDCLLCFRYHAAAGSPKDLNLSYELPLAGMRVYLTPAEDYQNEFGVISVKRSFNLVAKSPKERDEWMKALNNAIHDNIKKRTCTTPDQDIDSPSTQLGKEAPVWIQDSRVTMCQLCTAEFTVTFRRHHCRACGKVVCGNCSGNKAPLKYLQNAAARVCDSCYEYLLEDFDKLAAASPTVSDNDRACLREKFKKDTPNVTKRATKLKRTIPSRLEVNANSSGARISGYLNWKEKEKKNWKRRWFVLIDRVLYVYAASEDIVAIKSVPLLGWQVELDQTEPTSENEENHAIFRLKHLGQQPIHFQADSLTTAEKWMTAMNEAVVL